MVLDSVLLVLLLSEEPEIVDEPEFLDMKWFLDMNEFKNYYR